MSDAVTRNAKQNQKDWQAKNGGREEINVFKQYRLCSLYSVVCWFFFVFVKFKFHLCSFQENPK